MVSKSSPPADIDFLDQDCRYKSVTTQISHDRTRDRLIADLARPVVYNYAVLSSNSRAKSVVTDSGLSFFSGFSHFPSFIPPIIFMFSSL